MVATSTAMASTEMASDVVVFGVAASRIMAFTVAFIATVST